jgi:hypothetical protein
MTKNFYPLNLARFRILVADDTDRLTRTFAGARVGGSALTANWKTAAVPNTAITVDGLEPLQISLHFPAKIAFDRDLVVRYRVNDLINLLRREIFGP